ncbi:unnamed protein product [Linum tenue]|uniref:BRX domain-containing protein n=1 Tax=Linum tenue TaxID=586396 RepID=A0AAV0IWQ5_9ROSI|nr:unnamed protein product [Linum tenue]
MADSQRVGLGERDIDQDESTLIWYSGKDEKQLKLCQVTKIIPGQRTAIFHRYPRPEKEYQSFSLIYGDRSLDLDLEAIDGRDSASDLDSNAPNRLGKAFSDIVTYTASINHQNLADSTTSTVSSLTIGSADNIPSGRSSTNETFRVSLSSAVSSSSQGSCQDDFDALGDVFIWGEGSVDGALGCGVHRVGNPSIPKSYALLPKALESTVVLDVYRIACGSNHAALVTRHGEIFSWGQGLGGRLGHGKEVDVPLPTLIDGLSGMNVDVIACGEYHTCAVTLSGDLYTWGDGTHNYGLLGHGSEHKCTSGSGIIERDEGEKGSCGLWHTAVVAEEVITDPLSGEVSAGPSSGKLFTWGNGDEGCLGHGDENPRLVPEQVVTLVDENICQVACGHNLTVVLTILGQVYTMGSSTYGQLGCPKANGKLPNLVKDDTRNMNVTYSEEIQRLREQVEHLTLKIHRLEAEVETKANQLKQVTSLATDEAEKCKSAKEVIKSLTTQLKEMVERASEGEGLDGTKHESNASHSANELSREIEPNGNSIDNHMLTYGPKCQNEKPQHVIQAEPGVFITLSSLPGGANELKRVRFSRKYFSEEEAERWWTEKGTKVCERYNIHIE